MNLVECVFLKFVNLIHLLLCLFIILGPFLIKSNIFLLFYVFFVSGIILHWMVSSDVCVLTLVEQFLSGKQSHETFIGRIVGPVYNVTNKTIVRGTYLLVLIAVLRIYYNVSIKGDKLTLKDLFNKNHFMTI